MPTGLERIALKAEEHIKTISNVSDSMMGFDRADVAAKAIAYKQQRGLVNLSKVLDNLERTDWILARNVLDLVQEYYSNERIINITHDDFTKEPEEIRVNQVDPATGKYVYRFNTPDSKSIYDDRGISRWALQVGFRYKF